MTCGTQRSARAHPHRRLKLSGEGGACGAARLEAAARARVGEDVECAPPVKHLGCRSGRHHLVCHGPLAHVWKTVEAAPRALACSQEGVCQGITTARLGRVEPSRAVVAHDAELDHLCTWQQWVWVPPAWGRSAHLFANWAHARLGGALAASPHRYRRQRLEEARVGEICIIAERDNISRLRGARGTVSILSWNRAAQPGGPRSVGTRLAR